MGRETEGGGDGEVGGEREKKREKARGTGDKTRTTRGAGERIHQERKVKERGTRTEKRSKKKVEEWKEKGELKETIWAEAQLVMLWGEA